MTATLHPFPNPDALTMALADHIDNCLRQAITNQGRAAMAVSGGSSPRPLFTALAQRKLPWSQVTITLVDERWVSPADQDSNEHLVRTHLLQNQARKAQFIGLKNISPTASQGVDLCAQALEQIPLPFDLVILGMGNDGHTASFFPGANQLTTALDLTTNQPCCAIIPPSAPHARMTLTLATLLTSRQIIIHLVGNAKKEVYDTALAGTNIEQMPIRAILQQDTVKVATYWSP